jgi:hypothetical protein
LFVAVGNLIVGSSEVGTSINEFNMEVGIIILLEFSSIDRFLIDASGKSVEFLSQSLNGIFIYFLNWSWLWVSSGFFLLLWGHNLDFLWYVWVSLNFLTHDLDLIGISVLWDSHGESNQVSI